MGKGQNVKKKKNKNKIKRQKQKKKGKERRRTIPIKVLNKLEAFLRLLLTLLCLLALGSSLLSNR